VNRPELMHNRAAVAHLSKSSQGGARWTSWSPNTYPPSARKPSPQRA